MMGMVLLLCGTSKMQVALTSDTSVISLVRVEDKGAGLRKANPVRDGS